MSEPHTTVHSAFAKQIASVAGTRYSQLQTGAEGLFEAVLQLANHQSPLADQVTSTPEPTEEVTVETQATTDAKADSSSREESETGETTSEEIPTNDPTLVCPIICDNATTPITPASEPTPEVSAVQTEVVSEPAAENLADGEVAATVPQAVTNSLSKPEAATSATELNTVASKSRVQHGKQSKATDVVTPTTQAAAPTANVTAEQIKTTEAVTEPTAVETEKGAVDVIQTTESVQENTRKADPRERRGNGEKRWTLGPKPIEESTSAGVVQPIFQEATPKVDAAETLVPTETNSVALAAPIEVIVSAAETAVQAVASTLNSPANAVVAAGAATVASRAIEGTASANAPRSGIDGVSTRNTASELRAAQNTNITARPGASNSAEEPDGPASTAIDRARLVQRVSRAFQRLTHDGGTVRIRLHPPSLGAVRVEVQVEGNRMTARMTAESETARALLQDQIADLRLRLNEQGFQVDRIQVESDRNLFNSGSDQQQAFERPDEQNSQRRGPHSFAQQSGPQRQKAYIPDIDANITRTASLGSLDIHA